MPLNLLIKSFVLKELIYLDNYNKIQIKLKHKNARFGRSVNMAKFV